MVSNIFLPRVAGHNISRMSKDCYSVSVNNGNLGACVMNKEQLSVFIAEQKEKGNVKPPVAKVGLLSALGLIGLNILTRGRLFNGAKGLAQKTLNNIKNIFKK